MSDMFLTVCIMYNYTVKYTYMQIFSNGCSFLTPRPKDNVDTYVSKIIAEGYGTDLHNIAMGGRGNKRINFTTKSKSPRKKKYIFQTFGFIDY